MNIRLYYYLLMVAVIILIATVGVYAFELSEDECIGGAKITTLAAIERDKHVSKQDLLKQTQNARDNYSRPELYEVVLIIIDMVYAASESTPKELGDLFISECYKTKGLMYQRM